MTDPADGRVLQVNVSPGGVPKHPVDRAWVGTLGLDGDAHEHRTVHGGPHRAVALLGIEAIERVQADGHPVEPGSVGENVTTAGRAGRGLHPGGGDGRPRRRLCRQPRGDGPAPDLDTR